MRSGYVPEKALNNSCVFLGKDGARGVNQRTARCQSRPERAENGQLRVGEGADVRFPF